MSNGWLSVFCAVGAFGFQLAAGLNQTVFKHDDSPLLRPYGTLDTVCLPFAPGFFARPVGHPSPQDGPNHNQSSKTTRLIKDDTSQPPKSAL